MNTTDMQPRARLEMYRALNDELAALGDKWSVLTLHQLEIDGPSRFSEIQRQLTGISQRMLTLSLRNLEREGLILRTVYPTVPVRVEYKLTPLGASLQKRLATIAEWAYDNVTELEEARLRYDATQIAK